MSTPLSQSAHTYARIGRRVFPCKQNKKPLTSNGFQAASTVPSEIDAWWGHWPDANIGIATGASGLVVIDVDSTKPECEWDDLVAKLGKLPDTATVRTQSGGYHYYFEAPDGIEVKSSAGKLAAGVDIRAQGGYVIAPPSVGENGVYEWIVTTPPKPLPHAWLDAILKAQSGKRQPTAPAMPTQGRFKIDETSLNLLSHTGHERMPETPDNIDGVKNMLAAIPADCSRDDWRNICWAVMATGWDCAEELARDWSQSAPDKFDEGDFQKVVDSFQPNGGIRFGTLVHHARQHGYVEVLDSNEVRLTGDRADVENGEHFANAYRDKLLFIHETGKVLSFDITQGWMSASPGAAEQAAKELLKRMAETAAWNFRADPTSPKAKQLLSHVRQSHHANNLKAMLEMAKSESGMTARLSEFDADSMLLGVANGVLDLRTRTLLPVLPTTLVSKRCNVSYDPEAACPRFLQFMEEIQPDIEVRDFLQRAAGYLLTGSVAEQKLLFLYGEGANGKSVFVELLAWLLGDYAGKIATEMLMQHQRSPQGPSPDIVALKGRRFVYANETEEGRKLAEARVKDMTGGDTLIGRVPYGKADIVFQPTHKLFIVGNHKPVINDNSIGMWRRVALIPFDVTFSEDRRDPNLLRKLKAEGAGILNWALDGLRQWEKQKLAIPKQIQAATQAYREDQDIIGDWINEHCETGAGCREDKADLYKAYQHWARDNGHGAFAQTRLTRQLTGRGYKTQPDKRTIGGIKLNENGRRSAARIY